MFLSMLLFAGSGGFLAVDLVVNAAANVGVPASLRGHDLISFEGTCPCEELQGHTIVLFPISGNFPTVFAMAASR